MMLLSVWLKFVSQPTFWADGILMYPRPSGNHAMGKRRVLGARNFFFKAPCHVHHTQQPFPKCVLLGLWPFAAGKSDALPISQQKKWILRGVKWRTCGHVSGTRKPKAFQVLCPFLLHHPCFTHDRECPRLSVTSDRWQKSVGAKRHSQVKTCPNSELSQDS